MATDEVYRWDVNALTKRLKELCSSPEVFLREFPKTKETDLPEFSFEEGSEFLKWAVALLKTIPDLDNVRYKLVPTRMKEEDFWRRFYYGIRLMVKQHCLESIEHLNKATTNVSETTASTFGPPITPTF